jgi:lipoprotein-anchoring transpeptidase ErfK/SrfK/LysM repeat protein
MTRRRIRTTSLIVAILGTLLVPAAFDHGVSAQGTDPNLTTTWQASYWNNTNLSGLPVLERAEDNLDHDWGSGSPDPAVVADGFSARWMGSFSFAAGTYQFIATSDDGLRVWLDGELIIDSWNDQAATSVHTARTLEQGAHAIRVEYYENNATALARLMWHTGEAECAQQIIYVVESGDTLYSISLEYGVSVAEIVAANNLGSSQWIYPGQELIVPCAAPNPPELSQPDPLVPDPIPPIAELPVDRPDRPVSLTYARVLQNYVPVYSQPGDTTQKRHLGAGYIWVSVIDKVNVQGFEYYQINPGEYVRADVLRIYSPSTFHGIALAASPERPFAWILNKVQPHITPAGKVNHQAPIYQRYDRVQIFASQYVGSQRWYLIGPHQWIRQTYVGKIELSSRPVGVEPGARWVEVNLFEQTLAAYDGDRMVYATLISSGLPVWNTPPGLYRGIQRRVEAGKMSGGFEGSDYYWLEDVPWTLYYSGAYALHAAYWHDNFGYRESHGCVNMAPYDAQWVFQWAPDDLTMWIHR